MSAKETLFIQKTMFKHRIEILKEKFWTKLAWSLPKTLVYWAAIRLMAFATQGEYGTTEVPDLTAMDALKRWETA